MRVSMLGVALSVAGAGVTVIVVLIAVALVFVPPREAAASGRTWAEHPAMHRARALGMRTSRALDLIVFLPALAVQVPTERISRILPRGGAERGRADAGGGRSSTLFGIGFPRGLRRNAQKE